MACQLLNRCPKFGLRLKGQKLPFLSWSKMSEGNQRLVYQIKMSFVPMTGSHFFSGKKKRPITHSPLSYHYSLFLMLTPLGCRPAAADAEDGELGPQVVPQIAI